jgi:hypothetical protein
VSGLRSQEGSWKTQTCPVHIAGYWVRAPARVGLNKVTTLGPGSQDPVDFEALAWDPYCVNLSWFCIVFFSVLIIH